MRHMRHTAHINLMVILAIMLVLVGCGGSDSGSSDSQAEPILPDAQSLLEESADYIQNAESIELEIQVSGYPVRVYMDDVELLASMPLFFKYARGIFVSPDRMSASIQFSLEALSTTAQLIALDRDHYFQLDLLGNRWFQGELISGFSPASLMAQSSGIAFALKSVENLEMIGEENLDGLKVYHLHGQVDANAVYALTFGLTRTVDGILEADLYIRPKNHHLAVLKLIEPPPDGVEDPETTVWTITIVNYNQPASINPPETED